MSNHLIILGIGVVIGASSAYLSVALWANRHRPKNGAAGNVLQMQCQPIETVRLADLPENMEIQLNPPVDTCPLTDIETPDYPARNQPNLFDATSIFQVRGKPIGFTRTSDCAIEIASAAE